MNTLTSRDGTSIACARQGRGPAVVLVDGALCHRSFGPLSTLAGLLASDFTVFTYDRRGRGESGDTSPYAVDRELEDIAALITAAGGTAAVYAVSSGAVLALEAAARGLPISRLAVFEPPFRPSGEAAVGPGGYSERLRDALSAGRRGEAVALFLTTTGIPDAAIAGMRAGPAWPMLEAIAPTLAYDDAIMGDGRLPTERLASVATPTLVLSGGASPEAMCRAAAEVAHAVPGAGHRVLEGETHAAPPEVLAPVLREFFR